MPLTSPGSKTLAVFQLPLAIRGFLTHILKRAIPGVCSSQFCKDAAYRSSKSAAMHWHRDCQEICNGCDFDSSAFFKEELGLWKMAKETTVCSRRKRKKY